MTQSQSTFTLIVPLCCFRKGPTPFSNKNLSYTLTRSTMTSTAISITTYQRSTVECLRGVARLKCLPALDKARTWSNQKYSLVLQESLDNHFSKSSSGQRWKQLPSLDAKPTGFTMRGTAKITKTNVHRQQGLRYRIPREWLGTKASSLIDFLPEVRTGLAFLQGKSRQTPRLTQG